MASKDTVCEFSRAYNTKRSILSQWMLKLLPLICNSMKLIFPCWSASFPPYVLLNITSWAALSVSFNHLISCFCHSQWNLLSLAPAYCLLPVTALQFFFFSQWKKFTINLFLHIMHFILKVLLFMLYSTRTLKCAQALSLINSCYISWVLHKLVIKQLTN